MASQVDMTFPCLPLQSVWPRVNSCQWNANGRGVCSFDVTKMRLGKKKGFFKSVDAGSFIIYSELQKTPLLLAGSSFNGLIKKKPL